MVTEASLIERPAWCAHQGGRRPAALYRRVRWLRTPEPSRQPWPPPQ